MEKNEYRTSEHQSGSGQPAGEIESYSAGHSTPANSPSYWRDRFERTRKVYEDLHREYMDTSVFSERGKELKETLLPKASEVLYQTTIAYQIDKQNPFVTLGFYLDIIDPFSGKLIGLMDIELPDRTVLGHNGRKASNTYEPMIIKSCTGKSMMIKASAAKPKTYITELQIKCGAVKPTIPNPNPKVGDHWYDFTTGREYFWEGEQWAEITIRVHK